MSDREEYQARRRRSDSPTWKWLAGILVGIVLGLLSWIGIVLHTRMTSIEEQHAVYRANFATVTTQITDIKDGIAEIKQQLLQRRSR